MSRLDNYYESINALAAGQPEQFIHASEERYRNIIRRVAEQAVSRVRLPLSCSQGQALPVKPPRRAKSPRPS